MGVSHQLLPAVATIDMASAALITAHLGFGSLSTHAHALATKATQHSPASVRYALSKSASSIAAAAAAATTSARGGAGGWLQGILSGERSLLQSQPPFRSVTVVVAPSGPDKDASWKVLLMLFMTCLARCSVIILASRSIATGIRHRRAGGRAQDWTDTAVFCSIACVISVLVGLYTLNAVFQSRGLTRPGSANTSISGILGMLDSGSFAAEQLFVSFFEWVLFIAVMATNKELARPASSRQAQTVREGQDATQGYTVEDTSSSSTSPASDSKTVESTAADQPKAKEYGSITHSFPSTHALNSTGTASGTSDETKADASSVPATSYSNGLSSQTAPNSGHAASLQGNGHNGLGERASADASTVDGTANSAAAQDHGSDIVDVPRDRKASMQAAKDRLQRARENGRVRRRSLWKKIRGKNDDSASIMTGNESTMS